MKKNIQQLTHDICNRFDSCYHELEPETIAVFESCDLTAIYELFRHCNTAKDFDDMAKEIINHD